MNAWLMIPLFLLLIELIILVYSFIDYRFYFDEKSKTDEVPRIGNVNIKDIKCIDGQPNIIIISADWKSNYTDGVTYIYETPKGNFKYIIFVRDFDDLNTLNHELMHIKLAEMFNNSLPIEIQEMICYPYGWIAGFIRHKPNITECPDWWVEHIEWENDMFRTLESLNKNI